MWPSNLASPGCQPKGFAPLVLTPDRRVKPPAGCFRARRPSWSPSTDGWCHQRRRFASVYSTLAAAPSHRQSASEQCNPRGCQPRAACAKGDGGLPSSRRARDRCTPPPGKVPPSTAALVVATLGPPEPCSAGACSCDCGTGGGTEPLAERPRVRQPLWLSSPEGQCQRQRRLAFAARHARRPADRQSSGRSRLRVAQPGRSGPATQVACLLCLSGLTGSSAARATVLFRRVCIPAWLGLVLGRVGRVESTRLREFACASRYTRSGRFLQAEAVPSMRAWSPDPLGFGPSGPEGETLVLQGLAPARESRPPCIRPCARANAFERVRPPVADRPCAWRRRTGHCPLRGGLALSSSVRFRRARPGQESGLCAARCGFDQTWALCSQKRSSGSAQRLIGACSFQSLASAVCHRSGGNGLIEALSLRRANSFGSSFSLSASDRLPRSLPSGLRRDGSEGHARLAGHGRREHGPDEVRTAMRALSLRWA